MESEQKQQEYEIKKYNQDIKSFINEFDNKFNQYLDEKEEEEQRNPIEIIIDQLKVEMEEWKEQQYEKIKSMNNEDIKKQMKIINKDFNEIKKDYQELIDRTQQVIEQKQENQNEIMKQYVGNLQDVKELYNCKKQIWIYNSNKIDDDRKRIQQYEYKNEKYRIWICYGYNSSLEYKMEVMKMINELNLNHKVGMIQINLNIDNPINEEIIQIMANSYKNVYWISIVDNNNSVYNSIHDQIKQLVRQSITGNLQHNNDGLQLFKEYNQIIKQKQYLEQLRYDISRIMKISESKQGIQLLINEINEM